MPDGTRECQRVPDGDSGCQIVPDGTRGCQRDQIGTVDAPGLGKASDLIFVTVSIAGVEVVALVDTGATTSCCRWEWYQKWKDHLGAVIKSKVRIIGVGPDPIKIKGLTRPLTLHWDGVGGKFQLMILTALTDVDVVLGMDVLSQLDVKIDFKKQVARPAREACTLLEPAKTVGLLLNNPGFTFKGKIPVKEEGVEEVVKGVLRQGHREVHRVWMASERKMKTKEKRKDRRIVRESSMPWDKAGYKAQLQRDLKDIQHKLSQVLGKDLAKSDNSFVEATSPVKCLEGGVLVDLCMQRSGKRGSGCDAPKSADRFPNSSDGCSKSSEGCPIPVASTPRPPTPPAAQIIQNSGRKYVNKEVCMYIRTLKPLRTQKDSMFKGLQKSQRKNITSLLFSRQKPEGISQQYSVIRDDAEHSNSEMNQLVHASQYANDKYTLESSKARKGKEEVKFKPPGSTNDDDIECDVIEHGNDATNRDTDVNKLIARKCYAPKKHSFVHTKEFLKSSLRVCSRTFSFIAFILAIVISVVGGLFNIRLPERKSTIATSSEPLVASRFLDSPVLSGLREFAATIIHIREGLCPCMHKRKSLNNNNQLIRCMKILQNTIICDETFCTNRSLLALIMQLVRWQRLQERSWRENVWLHIYSRSRTSGLSEYII